MVKALTEAVDLWNQPAEMLEMWEGSDSKLADELRTMEWVGTGTVVDLGCGPGRFASYIPPEHYTGYDGSAAMIAAAKQFHPLHTFSLIDIFEFQINAKFDVVLLHDVAQHQDNPIEAIIRILTLWRGQRYIFSLLVGDRGEHLLNSTVVSLSELLSDIYKPYNVTRLYIDPSGGNPFARFLIEVKA